MENSFKSIIDASKSVLILLPTEASFDQVAAALSLYLAIRDRKEVQVYSPTPMVVEFNRLIAVNKITQELGNKNLIIRFVDYKASDIERVSYDIENSQFKLTVIPKQRITPPAKEQVELSYSGISADCVIMIGGVNESDFATLSAKELIGANIVHIGTADLSFSSNKTYVSFSKPASSVSEIIFNLIKESGFPLSEDIATNLLMGIEKASDNFTAPQVSAETFAVVSELMRAGGRRMGPQLTTAGSYPPGSIPGSLLQSTLQQQVQTSPGKTPVQKQGGEKGPPSDWLQPKIYKGTSIS